MNGGLMAMNDEPGPRGSAARASVLAGAATAAVGAFVICGWIWQVEPLKSIYGPITMKTNAAIGLLLCGTAMMIWRRSRLAARLCAAAAGLIGAATLTEHLTGWDLAIDQLLFTETPGAAATTSPNRMGPIAATNFVLAGIALYRIAGGDASGVPLAQKLAFISLVLASVPTAGYLYGAEQLYGIARYTGIALHTALSSIVLNVGILLARAGDGPVRVVLDPGPAGTMLRRLALPLVGIPLVLGYVEISARQAELVDRGLGIASYAVALVVVLGMTLWHTAQVIERSDRARRRAEHELDLLIASERQARADAERANRLKDQFMATLSHELRTPLNVILGWTRILEHGMKPDDHVRIAGLVAKNGRLLARLVEDLLDMSRVTTGHFEIVPSPVMLNGVAEASLDAISPAAEEKGIKIMAELDPAMTPVQADPERVQQIVWNLLTNAVKFTSAGGRIVVRTSDAGDAALLTVADTGIGFDEAFAPELFKPFRQADTSASRHHGGLGLGLSISRHLAELHGGSLVGSSPGVGHGATFTLALPRVMAGAEYGEPAPALVDEPL